MIRSIILTNHKGGVGNHVRDEYRARSSQRAAPLRREQFTRAADRYPSRGHASPVTTGRRDFGTDDSLYSVLMADRKEAAQVLADCIIASTWDTTCTCCLPHHCWNKPNAS